MTEFFAPSGGFVGFAALMAVVAGLGMEAAIDPRLSARKTTDQASAYQGCSTVPQLLEIAT